jgi:hypothetical protein
VERPDNPRTITLREHFDRDAILKDFYRVIEEPCLPAQPCAVAAAAR